MILNTARWVRTVIGVLNFSLNINLSCSAVRQFHEKPTPNVNHHAHKIFELIENIHLNIPSKYFAVSQLLQAKFLQAYGI